MTDKPYLLTQAELKVAANCHLEEQYGSVDCDHCPIGYYCQDIGIAYQVKLLEWLYAPCTEHRREWRNMKSMVSYPSHRYQCPECMQQFKGKE